MYEGSVNWDVFRDVKCELKILFMVNGDVRILEDVKWILEYIGVDGVMIGWVVFGNLWMIYCMVKFLEIGEFFLELELCEKM